MDETGRFGPGKPRLQLGISGDGDLSDGFAVQEEAGTSHGGNEGTRPQQFTIWACRGPAMWSDAGIQIRTVEFPVLLPERKPVSPSPAASNVVARFSRRYGMSSLVAQSPVCPPAKKREHDGGESRFEWVPEAIVQQILARLSICDLMRAQMTCAAWRTMVSSCRIFRALYDERIAEKWIALGRHGQNPDGFALFNPERQHWTFLHLSGGWSSPSTAWTLEAASDGLALLVSHEGSLVVANPLTRSFRALPDAKITSRLRLASSLRRLIGCSSRSHGRPVMGIVPDSASGSFRVIVVGEFRKKAIGAMVYSSATGSWEGSANREIDAKIFRRLTQPTLHGTTVYGVAEDSRLNLVSYDIESDSFLSQEISRLECPGLSWAGEEARPIRVVPYGNRVVLLGVVAGRHPSGPSWRRFTVMAAWESTRRPDEWTLMSFTTIQWLDNIGRSGFLPSDVVAACDGGDTVWVIFKDDLKMISLNLDTKEWSAGPGFAKEMNSAPRGRRVQEHMKAFSMRLKLSTPV